MAPARTCLFDLASHPTMDILCMITELLECITHANDHHLSLRESCFHARTASPIDIHSYLARILVYTPCPNECFLSLLVYLDRMACSPSRLRIDSRNIHRLIIAGVMVATKFFSDRSFTNARYAKVGGISVTELNSLEIEFLRLNNYSMNVSVEELENYGNQLVLHANRQKQARKNWRAL
ncbi:cyclin [Phycomyces blakesleeanus]|uniref:Cyclin n=2 Tax=Phycomyces blakesleeanus TaxID=4837 RepID=A0A167L2N0_PHYB8|nr:cyclin [Phycomyces blakesleeanus NRRL 1555(-)]OAD69448.1 cyclin [Phycomyces blakesleeanus NRRL 1555(-)]|eukprot:XP_018287488.1 cyclin [Phycomyces blakesleeanus NRRL 1555(-)]